MAGGTASLGKRYLRPTQRDEATRRPIGWLALFQKKNFYFRGTCRLVTFLWAGCARVACCSCRARFATNFLSISYRNTMQLRTNFTGVLPLTFVAGGMQLFVSHAAGRAEPVDATTQPPSQLRRRKGTFFLYFIVYHRLEIFIHFLGNSSCSVSLAV